ncbi:MAG: RHS repeat-associated core domain-containing protein, partial [bacterium]
NDGTTTTVATLAPSGRVLRRVVITNSTGVVSEDTSFGYHGPGDSPAYQIPTPSTLGWPVMFNDKWTDTSGDGWDTSKWVTTSNDSTKVADVQSNQGRLYVNGSPARATSQTTATADAEVNFTYRFNERTSGSFLRIFMRASGASGSNQMPNAYRLEVASGTSTIKLQKFANSVVTDIGSFTYTQDTNAQRVRFQVQGSTIRAKVWSVGTTEPVSWSVTATDTAITGTGVIQVAHSHSSGTHTVYLDDLALSTPAPTVTPVVTTYVSGPTGLLMTDTGGTATYPIANGHGDIVGTTNAAGTYTANPSTDEFGRGTTPASRLGWLGTAERFVENTNTGIIRMGVRLYDPNLGRFLSVDPIEGGSANDYDYANGDPINNLDLGGTAPYTLNINEKMATELINALRNRDRALTRFYVVVLFGLEPASMHVDILNYVFHLNSNRRIYAARIESALHDARTQWSRSILMVVTRPYVTLEVDSIGDFRKGRLTARGGYTMMNNRRRNNFVLSCRWKPELCGLASSF